MLLRRVAICITTVRNATIKKTKPIAAQWREDFPQRWLKDVKKAHAAWRSRLDGGIYLLVTTDGLYVGESSQLKLRLQQHTRGDNFGIEVMKNTKLLQTHILEIENDTEKRKKLEKKYIKMIKPDLNIEHNSEKYTKAGGIRNVYTKK